MQALMRIKRFFLVLLGRRLQVVLIVFSSLVAAFTVALSTLVMAGVTRDYLAEAEAVTAMETVRALYQIELEEAVESSRRLAVMPQVIDNLSAAELGRIADAEGVSQRIINEIVGLYRGSVRLVLVLDNNGNIVAGHAASSDDVLTPLISRANWGAVPIIASVLRDGEEQAAFEVISHTFLAQVGLAEPARISPEETLQDEGALDAGEIIDALVLTSVYPARDEDGRVVGAVATVVLLNNDVTLVDRAKEASGTSKVAVFLQDQEISTSGTEKEGRLLGMRMVRSVSERVLAQGRDIMDLEHETEERFVSHYVPLRDHREQVVGGLYVRCPEKDFLGLVALLNQRLFLIALLPGIVAALIAVPIARAITYPVTDLVEANLRLSKGDMTVRVETFGTGELAVLGQSFNSMVKRLFETQRKLMHKEKLAAVGQLAAGVAHELNNPLSAIMLLSDVLCKEASAGDRRADLEIIVGETARCKRIIGDLLNFARQNKILAQETDVHALLEAAIEKVDYQPSFDGVRIVRRFSPDLPMIYADPDQLLQVFVNLLNNGAEAMENGGEITLATRLIDSYSIEIQVADTGCGIPEEHLPKLFTPFFTTKPPGKGTGLGLSIVHGIIKMHRGWITVQGQVGEGSTFTITLPVQLPAEELQSTMVDPMEVAN